MYPAVHPACGCRPVTRLLPCHQACSATISSAKTRRGCARLRSLTAASPWHPQHGPNRAWPEQIMHGSSPRRRHRSSAGPAIGPAIAPAIGPATGPATGPAMGPAMDPASSDGPAGGWPPGTGLLYTHAHETNPCRWPSLHTHETYPCRWPSSSSPSRKQNLQGPGRPGDVHLLPADLVHARHLRSELGSLAVSTRTVWGGGPTTLAEWN